MAWRIGNQEQPRFHHLRYHKHLPGLRIISCVLESGTNGPSDSIWASSSTVTLIFLISDHLQQRFDCIGRPPEFRKRRLERNPAPLQYTDRLTHLPPDLTHSVFLYSPLQLFLRTSADILLRLFLWLSIQTLMRLRHGRTKSPPKTTPIALHLHQPLPHRLPRCSPSMRLHHRARSHPYLEVGQAQGGSMSRKFNSFPVHIVCKARQPHRTRRWSSQNTLNANHLECSHLRRLLLLNVGSIQEELSDSTRVILKMGRSQTCARGHHHLWCDKVKEKIISSTVLLVS